MRRACCAQYAAIVLAVMSLLALAPIGPGRASGQDRADRPEPKPVVSDAARAIDDEYSRQVLELGRRRLQQLAQLAATQKPDVAAATYERLFRLAIADDIFRDAEAAANTVIAQGTPSVETNALAHLVKVVAETDRGAFEQSLKSLRQAVAESMADRPAPGARAALAPGEVIAICEVYYQRLVEAGQFALASEAFRLVLENPYRPVVKDFLESRLKRINLVGKPAPPIVGTDLDGKEFSLAGLKGTAVLIVFWASWCQPSAEQVTWLEQVERSFRDKGLKVIGINLDTLEDGGQKPETVMRNIRRFLLDYNVPWPTLVNGAGDHDYARAYGVSDIPANVLVGRDGTVAQIDLSRRNLETVVARLLAP